ncbi:MAG: hypothetical protein HWD86_08320 [Kangiellaceae bacterium]|nr:hypothetical protein [Kangiellaceae bacterium]
MKTYLKSFITLAALFGCSVVVLPSHSGQQEATEQSVVSSSNNGAIIAEKAKSSLLLDIIKLSNGKLVTVGERGHILLSDDNGQTWKQSPVPSKSSLTAIDFFDDTHGVAVGFDQTILLTTDGGLSWTQTHQLDSLEQPALFDVNYVSKDQLVAIGSYGLYMTSEDGGATWDAQEVDSLADNFGGFSHFYSMTVIDSKNWILAGEKYVSGETADFEEINTGLLAKTNDGGQTWSKLASPYDGSFFGVNHLNGVLYAYGLRGNVYESRDQGQSWRSLFLKTAAGLHDMDFLPNGQWVLVGTGGVLIENTATGDNITKRRDLKGRAAVIAISDNELIIVGEGGVERVNLDAE